MMVRQATCFHLTHPSSSFNLSSSVSSPTLLSTAARLAQSAERETLNLKVAGSTPALGLSFSSFLSFSLPMCAVSHLILDQKPSRHVSWEIKSHRHE
ncbi:hypothetical protein BP00DRAFT_142330 [Aspergillus indologenus CBS 114.80]|uniref:Uncharacterized protein n=1 Tax=Aspergillus indologenus CBS 114.80 TaxID=1450541 RepID=A0A2V5I7X9_9EURO|nr:hypothetical protein BP00DRAFT_142330 [Aspergillus indologenus CBS 114.80]